MTTTRRLRATTVLTGVIALALGGGALLFYRPDTPPMWVVIVAGVSLIVGGVVLLITAIAPDTRTRSPRRRVADLESPHPPHVVRERLERQIDELGGVGEATTGESFRAQVGSQLALRMMGVTTRYGVDRLPYIVEAEIVGADRGTRVHLSLNSNEGWYLISTRTVDRAYAKRFDYVTALLAQRLA